MEDFGQVFAQYYPDVYRFVRSLGGDPALAEEIAQETFVKALQRIDGFRGQCEVRVWLCQIAKNAYYTHARKQRRQVPDAALPEQAATGDLEDALANREEALQVHRALHALAEPYKEVFTLRLFGELPFAQIALLFGKTESWARVTFYRAKQLVRDRMRGAKEGRNP